MSGFRRSPPARSALALLLLAAGLAAACGGPGRGRPSRPAGSAVWVAPEAARLEPADARTLAAAGVEEIFLETGRVSWAGGTPRIEAASDVFRAVPPGSPVTLVLRGPGPAAKGVDPGAASAALAADLRRLFAAAEAARLLPLGVHLDLEPPPGGGLAAYARLLAALRPAVGRESRVSATLHRQWLRAPEAPDLARAVDFLAAEIYGQEPGAADLPEAWDPETVVSDVHRLEALGRDFLVEAVVLGSATHLSAAAEPRETTTRARLKPLVTDPGLRLAIGDPFAGVGRVVHTFQAQRASRAGGWRLAPGEAVRVVQTAPGVVHQIVERIRDAAASHYLGLLFYRLAAPEEALSLAAGELAAVLGDSPPSPALAGRLVVKSRQSDRVILGFELRPRTNRVPTSRGPTGTSCGCARRAGTSTVSSRAGSPATLCGATVRRFGRAWVGASRTRSGSTRRWSKAESSSAVGRWSSGRRARAPRSISRAPSTSPTDASSSWTGSAAPCRHSAGQPLLPEPPGMTGNE